MTFVTLFVTDLCKSLKDLWIPRQNRIVRAKNIPSRRSPPARHSASRARMSPALAARICAGRVRCVPVGSTRPAGRPLPRGVRVLARSSRESVPSDDADAGCDLTSSSWIDKDALNPDLSFDEAFCILDKGCDNVLRRLTASEADVARLDRLLSDVSFDASRDEWLALLSRASDQPTDQTDPTGPADPAVSADDADSAACARSGATLCAVGVFDHVDDLVGLTSVAAYDPHPDLDPAADHSPDPFAWLGNVVVRRDYRRRGVADMCLRAALDRLPPRAVAWLDASDMAVRLYERAGFVPVGRVERWSLGRDEALRARRARGAWDVSPSSRDWLRVNPVAVADLDDETSVARAAMVAMDAGAFGADRTNVLETWRNTCPDLALCAPGMAYSLTHVRGDTAYLGPSGTAAGASDQDAAAFFEGALSLAVRALEARKDLRELVAYVPSDSSEDRDERDETDESEGSGEDGREARARRRRRATRRALASAGFEMEETTTRMARAPNADAEGAARATVPGRPERCLTVASLDLG